MPEEKPKILEDMTSEELGLAMNQQYNVLLQVQTNIKVIVNILEKRKCEKLKEPTS